jgi:hypothetical protein
MNNFDFNAEAFARIVVKTARNYYSDTANDPLRATPPPTPEGAEIFAQLILDRVRTPGVMRRAMEAAGAREVRPLYPNVTAGDAPLYPKSVFQQMLTGALHDFFSQQWRLHPGDDDRARAAAEVIIAEIGQSAERGAFGNGCPPRAYVGVSVAYPLFCLLR